ncbi:major capsid protein [Pseudooceanicola sp. CBS1P-1]|uniref:Major capsid protein n=1 Tax=Pseudooceanicola albus TaxID=2692189 RepID=A0A6L7FW68_9RHOB|nr:MULTISPECIES: major capsid protein [Pseudooceanicola]MBT9383323.1 major capsid protein [Pseudooceanicola endophyticus]MXN16354.1 major capsid protein [Pseudooceanicola albus]
MLWDNFGLIALTATLNNQPFVPGQVGATGIFHEEGVDTTIVMVEEQNGSLSIIEPTERGGPGTTVGDDERNLIPFKVDHFEINDTVRADEVQGVRLLGSTDQMETVQTRIDSKLGRHAIRLDATLEHQRVGAIKGIVLSGKGKVLHNLYDRFGIAVPAAVSLGLDGDVSKLASAIKSNVIIPMEDELDAAYSGTHAFCGDEFHAFLWDQPEVRETYLAQAGGTLRDGAPDVFNFGQITWERYRTGKKATAANGGAPFIAANKARIVPKGVPELFITRFAPADLEETVNTIGLPRYANQYPMANGKGRHLDSQMNAISLCTRPGVLREVTI